MSKLTITYERGVKKQFIDGVEATQAEVDARFPPKPFEAPMATMAYDASNPLVAQSAGCHPSQVPSMNEFLHKHHVVGAQFRPDGKVVFASRAARRDFCKARGLIDQDGGYGDA